VPCRREALGRVGARRARLRFQRPRVDLHRWASGPLQYVLRAGAARHRGDLLQHAERPRAAVSDDRPAVTITPRRSARCGPRRSRRVTKEGVARGHRAAPAKRPCPPATPRTRRRCRTSVRTGRKEADTDASSRARWCRDRGPRITVRLRATLIPKLGYAAAAQTGARAEDPCQKVRATGPDAKAAEAMIRRLSARSKSHPP
jgi:hypothetical protein